MQIDYAIISAMEEEVEWVLQQFSNVHFKEYELNKFIFKIYAYQNTKILIASTGIGTSFASCILTLIKLHFNPEYVLICGTAGGIHPDLTLRDVVIAEYAFEAEMHALLTTIKNTPFASCLQHPLNNIELPLLYKAPLELLNLCNNLDYKATSLFKGTVVSSNAFPAPKALFAEIHKMHPYAIDMETAAFYQTAWLLNIKILSIRGISNILNEDGTDEKIHEADVQGSADAAAHVLLMILDKLIHLKK